MKRTVQSEKGIALLTTLMLTVLGFGIVATLLYMVTYATKTTGLEQGYATALNAAKGGADFVINMMQNEVYGPPGLAGAVGPNSLCLEQKLTMATTDSNPSLNWPSCTSRATSSDPKNDPDLTLTLVNHQVYVKIIYTRVTNTNFFYTVNVRGEAPTPSGEPHAEINFVYQLAVP
jgi:hypothetical protein